MRPVLEIAQPGLERGGVVLADGFAVSDDGGFAADGGPFARRVQEGDIDLRVRFQVVRLPGFGVGVEKQVDAAALLDWGSLLVGS